MLWPSIWLWSGGPAGWGSMPWLQVPSLAPRASADWVNVYKASFYTTWCFPMYYKSVWDSCKKHPKHVLWSKKGSRWEAVKVSHMKLAPFWFYLKQFKSNPSQLFWFSFCKSRRWSQRRGCWFIPVYPSAAGGQQDRDGPLRSLLGQSGLLLCDRGHPGGWWWLMADLSERCLHAVGYSLL